MANGYMVGSKSGFDILLQSYPGLLHNSRPVYPAVMENFFKFMAENFSLTNGGFRRGELFCLEWQDIDFDTGILSVRRISSYSPARGIFTDTPKTNGSCRSLKLPESELQLLKQYKAAQAEEQLRVGEMWEGTGRLFVKWNGAPKHPGNAQK